MVAMTTSSSMRVRPRRSCIAAVPLASARLRSQSKWYAHTIRWLTVPPGQGNGKEVLGGVRTWLAKVQKGEAVG
jgi:hypothetical protein